MSKLQQWSGMANKVFYKGLLISFAVLMLVVVSKTANAQANDQISWSRDPFGIADFFNSRARAAGYRGIDKNPTAMNLDMGTATKICNLAGYNRVVSMDCDSQYGCGFPNKSEHVGGFLGGYPHYLSHWVPGRNNFDLSYAHKMGNRWIASLTCADRIGAPTPTPTPAPQCSNGRDDDGDGKVDSADSSCHTDFNPNNAGSYDASINDEGRGGSGTCNDCKDNNGNGLIDGADPVCHSDGNAGNPASLDGNRNETTATPTPTPTPTPCNQGCPTPTPVPTPTPTPSPCHSMFGSCYPKPKPSYQPCSGQCGTSPVSTWNTGWFTSSSYRWLDW